MWVAFKARHPGGFIQWKNWEQIKPRFILNPHNRQIQSPSGFLHQVVQNRKKLDKTKFSESIKIPQTLNWWEFVRTVSNFKILLAKIEEKFWYL